MVWFSNTRVSASCDAEECDGMTGYCGAVFFDVFFIERQGFVIEVVEGLGETEFEIKSLFVGV